MKALYRAARDGVEIDLVVRAICTLRPGVEGLSENIRVRSILGRFLEHARIFYFENGGDEEFYIGSADWRRRNLQQAGGGAHAGAPATARVRACGRSSTPSSHPPGRGSCAPTGRTNG